MLVAGPHKPRSVCLLSLSSLNCAAAASPTASSAGGPRLASSPRRPTSRCLHCCPPLCCCTQQFPISVQTRVPALEMVRTLAPCTPVCSLALVFLPSSSACSVARLDVHEPLVNAKEYKHACLLHDAGGGGALHQLHRPGGAAVRPAGNAAEVRRWALPVHLTCLPLQSTSVQSNAWGREFRTLADSYAGASRFFNFICDCSRWADKTWLAACLQCTDIKNHEAQGRLIWSWPPCRCREEALAGSGKISYESASMKSGKDNAPKRRGRKARISR